MTSLLLAYSGGLDSAVILHWLSAEGHRVTAFTAQLGGHPDTFTEQALANGATEAKMVDARAFWLHELARPARRLGAVYGRYFLHVALGKIAVAVHMAQLVDRQAIDAVAHGAHRGENDYHRFATLFAHLSRHRSQPIDVLAPWELPAFRRQFPNRQALLDYARRHDLRCCTVGETTLTHEPTLLGSNYENGELANFAQPPADLPCCEVPLGGGEAEVVLHFQDGNLMALDTQSGREIDLPKIVDRLSQLGGRLGIGVIDVVETNLDNSKARCVYVQPATQLWHQAHRELGDLLLDRSELRVRDRIGRHAGALLYRGEWFGESMARLQRAAAHLNRALDGWVALRLYPGFARVIGRGPARRSDWLAPPLDPMRSAGAGAAGDRPVGPGLALGESHPPG